MKLKQFGGPAFNSTPFIDTFLSLLMIFIIIFNLVPMKKSETDPALSANVVYQIVMDWDGKSDTDIDLWAKDPQDHIVGFKRREGGEGSLMSLSHDDLGHRNDIQRGKALEVNQEIISLRGTVEGEYIVNAHWFANTGQEGPTEVTCKLVKIKPLKEIIVIKRTLKNVGDQETFFRFEFDADGKVISTNELPSKFVDGDGES
jgi:hypothetical protein